VCWLRCAYWRQNDQSNQTDGSVQAQFHHTPRLVETSDQLEEGARLQKALEDVRKMVGGTLRFCRGTRNPVTDIRITASATRCTGYTCLSEPLLPYLPRERTKPSAIPLYMQLQTATSKRVLEANNWVRLQLPQPDNVSYNLLQLREAWSMSDTWSSRSAVRAWAGVSFLFFLAFLRELYYEVTLEFRGGYVYNMREKEIFFAWCSLSLLLMFWGMGKPVILRFISVFQCRMFRAGSVPLVVALGVGVCVGARVGSALIVLWMGAAATSIVFLSVGCGAGTGLFFVSGSTSNAASVGAAVGILLGAVIGASVAEVTGACIAAILGAIFGGPVGLLISSQCGPNTCCNASMRLSSVVYAAFAILVGLCLRESCGVI
jgi:hypothetical protein